jgi:release factor glutamine methyltransferase
MIGLEPGTTVADALHRITARLASAGCVSAEAEARWLLEEVLELPAGGLAARRREPLPPPAAGALEAMVERRVGGEPLQYVIGWAPFGSLRIEVGEGVFVPRPETELVAYRAARHLRAAAAPAVAVDLCTGSGAIAKAVKDEVPQAAVHAVELSEDAYPWAQRNLVDTGVDLRQGDMATAFDDLLGRVDVVVCNPPYVPLEAWESVAVEARDHDPHLALFAGADGLDAIRVLALRAAVLLRPGGVVGVEHADVQGETVPAIFSGTGRWTQVRDHRDLAGRPRFTTARLAP